VVDARGANQIVITVGSGDGVVVDVTNGDQNVITLGDGNNDTVIATFFNQEHPSSSVGDTITVGNGNDTIHVGANDTVTVGTGQDTFIFDLTIAGPGTIGAVTINDFDPSKDVIVIQKALATTFSASDDAHGNAVVTFPGDTLDQITLVGVHSSALHASDFQFV